MARARRARRPADAGDQALRRRRAGHALPRWPATSSSTTARGAGTASRSRTRRAGRSRRRHELRRRAGAQLGPGAPSAVAARRTSTRSTRRAWSRGRATASASSACTRPNGRVVGSPFYAGKLAWFERLRALAATRPRRRTSPGARRRLQRRPDGRRRVGRRAVHGGTHVSRARARGVSRAAASGDWSTRTGRTTGARPLHLVGLPGGNFHKNFGMRIDHLLVTPAGRARGSWTRRSIARRARASRSRPTTPRSSIDLDEPGKPFDAGWDGALERIAERTR